MPLFVLITAWFACFFCLALARFWGLSACVLDLGVFGEMFGNVAGVELRAAIDCLTVALNNDGKLHCCSGSDSSGPVDASGEESDPLCRGSAICDSTAGGCGSSGGSA